MGAWAHGPVLHGHVPQSFPACQAPVPYHHALHGATPHLPPHHVMMPPGAAMPTVAHQQPQPSYVLTSQRPPYGQIMVAAPGHPMAMHPGCGAVPMMPVPMRPRPAILKAPPPAPPPVVLPPPDPTRLRPQPPPLPEMLQPGSSRANGAAGCSTEAGPAVDPSLAPRANRMSHLRFDIELEAAAEQLDAVASSIDALEAKYRWAEESITAHLATLKQLIEGPLARSADGTPVRWPFAQPHEHEQEPSEGDVGFTDEGESSAEPEEEDEVWD